MHDEEEDGKLLARIMPRLEDDGADMLQGRECACAGESAPMPGVLSPEARDYIILSCLGAPHVVGIPSMKMDGPQLLDRLPKRCVPSIYKK